MTNIDDSSVTTLSARKRKLKEDDSTDTVSNPDNNGNSSTHDSSLNPFYGKFYSLDQILAMTDDEEWLLRDLLCKQDIMMLYGDSGVGKSFVALDMAFSLAAGIPWCNGQFIPSRPARVLYCVGEGWRGFRKRIKALHSHYKNQGIPIESDNLHVIPMVPQLFSPSETPFSAIAFMEALKYDCSIMPDLIIIDTMFRSILGADENSAKDATWVLSSLQQLVNLTGAAVILIHHVSRNGSERGSTSYKAAMESTIELKRDNDHFRTMICRKLKDGEEFHPQQYYLESLYNSAIVNWQGDASTSSVSSKKSSPVLDEAITKMQGSPDRWWTVAELASLLNKDSGNLTKSLQNGANSKRIDVQLGDGKRANPTKYRVLTTNTDEEKEKSLSLSYDEPQSQ